MQMKSKSSITTVQYWISILILIGCFLTYSNTLDHGYTLDDYSVILEHQHVQAGADGISDILSTNYRHGHQGFNDGLYRPLSLITFALEKEFFDSDPSIAHWTNLLIYSLGCILLFFALFKILGGNRDGAVLSGLIVLFFSSHPLHSEVVASVKSRDVLLAFLGFGLSLYGFVRSLENGKFYFLGLLGLAIALLSKESAVLYVFIIPLLIYLDTKVSFKQIQLILLGTLPLGTGFILLRNYIIGSMENPVDAGNFGLLNNPLAVAEGGERWGSTFALQLKFLEKLFLPIELIHDYSYDQIPLVEMGSITAILGLLVLLGLIAFGVYGFIRRNRWGMIALIYVFSILIASQLFTKIGVHFAERLLFIAVLPFAMLIVMLIHKALHKRNIAFIIVFVLVQGFYFNRTVARNADWKSNYTLYAADIETASASARVNYNYGSVLSERADRTTDEAEKQKLLNESATYLKRATKIYPDYLDAWNNLGIVYKKQGNLEAARALYEQNIRRDPDYAKNYYNLGSAYFELQDYGNALNYLSEYTRRVPNSGETYLLMAKAAGKLGLYSNAIGFLNNSLQYIPNNPEAFNMLGMAYGSMNAYDKAEASFLKAIELKPSNVQFLMNLAINYNRAGKTALEIQSLKKILSLDPDNTTAQNQLEKALAAKAAEE
jgi:tetratricopeptide (TPR) repeat protein